MLYCVCVSVFVILIRVYGTGSVGRMKTSNDVGVACASELEMVESTLLPGRFGWYQETKPVFVVISNIYNISERGSESRVSGHVVMSFTVRNVLACMDFYFLHSSLHTHLNDFRSLNPLEY